MRLSKPTALFGAVTLVGVLAGTTLGASALSPVTPTNCVVDSTGDEHVGSNALAPCESTSGKVTLRSAIELFNTQKGTLSITFSPSLPSPTTISLVNGVLAVTDTTKTDTLTVTGAGIDKTIVDAHHASALVSSPGAALSFNSITLENGETAGGVSGIAAGPTTGSGCSGSAVANVNLSAVRLQGNRVTAGTVYAGAIYGNKVSITDSFINNNEATATSGDYLGLVLTCDHLDLVRSQVTNNSGATSVYNYGIFDGYNGTTMTGSTISDNTMTSTGTGVDGVFDTSKLVEITDSFIRSNTLSAPGAGVDGIIDAEKIRVLRSGIDDNHQVGGPTFDCALVCLSTEFTLNSSSLSGNITTLGDRTVRSRSVCGLLACTGNAPVNIVNSTVANNSLTTGTGARLEGAYVDGNSGESGTVVTFTNATLARNEVHLGANSSYTGGPFVARSVTFQNTIVAENAPANCNTPISVTFSATHSLDSDGTCGFATGNGNLKNVSAGFVGGVQVNAPGRTRTLAIGATSPAKDTASNTLCPSTDQRGVQRLADDPVCDMGAYEYVRPPVVPPTASVAAVPNLPKAGLRTSSGAGARLPLLLVLALGISAVAGLKTTRAKRSTRGLT